MTVTTDYLAQFGITMQEAHDFVWSHIDDAQLIFTVAGQYGVTTTMLGEIAGGYSATEVRGFFAEHGLNGALLDDTGGLTGGYYNTAPGDPAVLVGTAPDMSHDFMA
jgi:hypothetical protein